MARLLRLVTAVSVLLVASLTGCLLSADQSAAMDVISVNAHGQNVRQLWSGGLPFAGAGMIIVALAVYSIRMRRSLCRLSISHANQNRFLEAIDQSHMGIVLFDAEMKTTCRSKGFDRQFADLIPLVSAGASIVQIFAFAFENGVFTSDARLADKLRRLEELKAQGYHVLMIGDGLNDTAALAAAHASIAPALALEASRSASDIVVLKESFAELPLILAVSRGTKRLSQQNFKIATIYNLVSVPLALAGFATPLAAALAMSISSITVLLNAQRMRWIS